MAIQQALDILIKFDLPVLPFFSLQDTTDYGSEGISSSNVKGNFTISNPLGQIYSNGSWVTPDITLSVSTYFNSVNIPLDSGVPIPGEYTFTYTVRIAGGVQPGDYSKIFTINYDYVSPTASIVMENNPYVALLTARDNTLYVIEGVTPTQVRVFTLIFPDLSGYPDIVNALTYIAVTNPFYIAGLYQATLANELNYSFLTYNVHDIISGANQLLVEDTTDIQSVYCCLKALNATVKANPNDLISDAKLKRATSLLELFNQAIQFGRYTEADGFIQDIYDVTGCTPGCTCGNLTKTSIQPYWLTTSVPGDDDDSESEFRVGDFKETFRSDAQSKWLYMEGQLLLIADYIEYYNVVGTAFNNGGEAPGYFRNEDSRSRWVVGAGQGPGLTNRVIGANYGAETVDASHLHAVNLLADGSVTTPALFVNITSLTAETDPATLTLDMDDYTPEGQIDISGLTTISQNTEDTALEIIGDSSVLNPVFVGDPVNYTPEGTSNGSTEDESLDIAGAGTLNINGEACVDIVDEITPGGTELMACVPLTIEATDIANALTISPNPHAHNIVDLPFTGTLDTITATGDVSIGIDEIAAALSITPNPHHHVIPELTASGEAIFNGTPKAPTGTVDVGGVVVSGTGVGATEETAYDISVPVVGDTEETTLILAIIPPSFAANRQVKVLS